MVWRAVGGDSSLPPPLFTTAESIWADEATCVDCHQEALTFSETGHARTLARADSPEARQLLLRLNDSPIAAANRVQIIERDTGLVAVHDNGRSQEQLPIDWCFGSGRHAHTWVGELTDTWGATEIGEFHWSWYHAPTAFDVTPGQPVQPPAGYFAGLGVLFDAPKAQRCFGCHTTTLPIHDEKLDLAHARLGVTCQACHGPQQAHVASEGRYGDSFWRTATPRESVDRCGQCHRRADEQPAADVRPDNPAIVRFQPVGLVQSPCFRGSQTMTCMTCHDPHRPLEVQDSAGIWQCTQCHDPSKPATAPHGGCGAGFKDDCLRCHMPKVRSDAPVSFTDHWIRVREDVSP